MKMIRLVILASGGGTTAAAIVQSCKDGVLMGKVEVVGLIASKPDIGAIGKLGGLGMKQECIAVIDRKLFANSQDFGRAILNKMFGWESSRYGQHGWLPTTPINVIRAYRGVNQHPAGLDPTPWGSHPGFGGKGMYGNAAIAAQLYFAQRIDRPFFAEATAHAVHEQVDAGLIIRSNRLRIDTTWSVDELQQKLLPIEHQTQIEALLLIYESNGVEPTGERSSRLILPGEEEVLEAARNEAIADYPRG